MPSPQPTLTNAESARVDASPLAVQIRDESRAMGPRHALERIEAYLRDHVIKRTCLTCGEESWDPLRHSADCEVAALLLLRKTFTPTPYLGPSTEPR